MSGTTAPLRAVPYDRYNGTIGAIFSANVVYKNKNKPKINIVIQNLTILG